MSLEAIKAAYERGDMDEVRRLTEELLRDNPNNEAAWVIKMNTAEHDFEREAAMNRVLALNPANEHALKLRQTLQAAPPPSQSETPISQAAPATNEIPSLEYSDSSTPEEPPVKSSYTRADGMRVEELGTYEMLWDCQYCGAKKLQGHSHKFCPNCGAQQNPATRYFPSDDEKVAVKDHVYYGVDITCASCGTLNSANAKFCVNCGTPTSEGTAAETLGEQVRGAGEKFEAGTSRDLVKEGFDAEMARIQGQPIIKEKSRFFTPGKIIGGGIATLVSLCVAIVAALMLWTTDTSVVVAGHSWEREIKIEEFKAVSEGDWCDSMPGDAYSISRSERQRGSRQVPDGEECTVRRVDNGDGTFSQRRECRTKYRSEPVYDDYCSYTVDRWVYDHSEFARGDRLTDIPYWPSFNLQGGSGFGAEREGDREETYTVHFRSSEDDKRYECDFDEESQWRQFSSGSEWKLEVGVIAGDAKCGSLERLQ